MQPPHLDRPAVGVAARPGPLRETGPGCYPYAPRSDELHGTVLRLAATYRERRVAVVTLIASKPIENVRAFSDAFRIRRRKED